MSVIPNSHQLQGHSFRNDLNGIQLRPRLPIRGGLNFVGDENDESFCGPIPIQQASSGPPSALKTGAAEMAGSESQIDLNELSYAAARAAVPDFQRELEERGLPPLPAHLWQPGETTPFRPFPLAALPEPIANYITAAADAVGCDPSMVALPTLAGLAGAIGNSVRIRLKDNWYEPSVLWVCVIGQSGTRKSAALDSGMVGLDELQSSLDADFLRQHAFWAQREQAREKRKSKGADSDSMSSCMDEPIRKRVITNDATIEAVAARLKENPNGIVLRLDEGGKFLGGFDRYKARGSKSEAAQWNEMFGARALRIDRATKPTIVIPHAAVSIAMAIQPPVFQALMTGDLRGSGFFARFLFGDPPRKSRQWTEADVPAELRNRLVSITRLLWTTGSGLQQEALRPVILDLDSQARACWIDYFNSHGLEELAMVGDGAQCWSKLEGYTARLALVLHVVRCAAENRPITQYRLIGVDTMRAAITLTQWFGSESLRVLRLFGSRSKPPGTADKVVGWIKSQVEVFTARELQRKFPKLFTAESAEAALGVLCQQGLLSYQDVPTGGRPRRDYTWRGPRDNIAPPISFR